MANDVNKPSFSDYTTKSKSQAPPPPCRDHQHNKNKIIPTITTQDQASAISSGISDTSNRAEEEARPKNKWIVLAAAMDSALFAPIDDAPGFTASDQDDFHTIPTITTQDQAFDSASVSDQDEVNKMTLEEQMEQYDEKYYNYFDNLDDDDVIEIPIPPGMFNTDDEFTTSITTEEKESNPPVDNIRIVTATTIEEAEIEQQQTRHTQSNDRPVTVILNNNTNTNKKKKKKAKEGDSENDTHAGDY